jgi:uncharacterized protein
MKRLVSGLFASILLGTPSAAAPAIPPAPTRYVTDHAGVLTAGTVQALEEELSAFEAATSNQFLVYTDRKIPEGTVLEEWTVEVARAWRAGQKERNNGLVLFVFPDSRAARFEVGYGLEGALPDALAGRILQNEAIPRFRNGDWDGGIRAAVDAAIAATKGEYKGTGRTRTSGRREEGVRIPFWVILLLLFVVLPLLRGGSRRRYWYIGGGGFGGGGFGGGGGGGWSGGGGSFGGGGASGRW